MEGGYRPHVLIVADERNERGCVGGLAYRGFRLTYTENQRVVADAARLKPDAIVIHVGDGLDGNADVCRSLVTGGSTRRIPLIAVAGNPPDTEYMVLLRVETCDANALVDVIERIAGENSARDEARPMG